MSQLYESLGFSPFVQAIVNFLLAVILFICFVHFVPKILTKVGLAAKRALPRAYEALGAIFDWHRAHEALFLKVGGVLIAGFLLIVTTLLLARAVLGSFVRGSYSSDLYLGLLIAVSWIFLIRWRHANLESDKRRYPPSEDGVQLTLEVDRNGNDPLKADTRNHTNAVLLRVESTLQAWIDQYTGQSRGAVIAGRMFAFAASIAPFFTWLYFIHLIMISDNVTVQSVTASQISNIGILTFLGASTGFICLAIAVVLFKYARSLNDKITVNEKRLYYVRKLRAALIAFPGQPDWYKGLFDSLIKTGDGFETDGLDEKGETVLDNSVAMQTIAFMLKGANKT